MSGQSTTSYLTGRHAPVVQVAHRQVLGESCEIIAAASVSNGFARNASETLGICFKLGRGHEVWCEGRRLHYAADAVCVRAPGCYWSCEPCVDGFVSIDIPVALLPPEMRTERMYFLSREPSGSLRPGTLRRLADPRVLGLEAEGLLTALLLDLHARGALQAPDLTASAHYRRIVGAARDFLLCDPSENISLPCLARAAGTTRWSLIRAFARELGTTPHAYLIQLRLGRARGLLRRGHGPAEAAAGAGFSDQAHLTRLLRRFSGDSPRAYMTRHWRIGFEAKAQSAGL